MKFDKTAITPSSIIILIIMIAAGYFIGSDMFEDRKNKIVACEKAIQITDEKEFKNALEDYEGIVLAYGELKAVDPITEPELDGEYMLIRKELQEYKKTGYSKHKWRIENTEYFKCERATFLNEEFPFERFNFSDYKQLKTIDQGHNERVVYFGIPATCKGTILTKIEYGTINSTTFYEDMDIIETIDYIKSGKGIIKFVAAWAGLTILIFVGMYATRVIKVNKRRR